jgi:hypothetical protein
VHKAGTVEETCQLQGKIPEEVYREVLRIVTILDSTYGADRDVNNGDGGFVLVVENVQDLALANQQYIDVGSNQHEAISLVQCANKSWLNIFFLCNNEFGINILMPKSIAPNVIIDSLKKYRASQ